MKYYLFEPATGEFLEEFESDETFGIWHRSITPVEPPEPDEGAIRIFNRDAQEWSYARPEDVLLVTQAEFQAESDKIHLELGRSITEWSRVEQWLCDLYRLLTCGHGPIPLGLSSAFYSVVSFRDKLNMVNALIKNSGLQKNQKIESVDHWSPIKSTLNKLSENRNKLAHGSIISPKPTLSGRPHALPVWVPYYDADSYKMFKLSEEGGIFSMWDKKFEEWSASKIVEVRRSFIEPQNLLDNYIGTFYPDVPRA